MVRGDSSARDMSGGSSRVLLYGSLPTDVYPPDSPD